MAIELGVSRTRVAAHPVAGPRTERWDVEFDTPARPETWTRRLSHGAAALRDVRPWGVALSVPGVCDEREGRVLLSPILPL